MSLQALGLRYTPLRGPEWVLVAVLIATLGVVAWESWESKRGNYPTALRIAVGIMFSFLAGMSLDQGIWLFRSHASNYRWVVDFLLGLACLYWSIASFTRRKAPMNFIEWLNERAKPLPLFDKKEN
jgi:hypothetical protein